MLHIAKPFNLVPAPDLIKDYKGSVCIFLIVNYLKVERYELQMF